MSLLSQFKKGSHSAALIRTTSIFWSGGGLSFTWLGNVAPPMPAKPAAATAFLTASAVSSVQVLSSNASGFSSSGLISMAGTTRPSALQAVSSFTTVPLTGL